MGARILVIEDDMDARALLKDWLSRAGFEPLLAANGAEGMRLLYNSRPSLILLDIMLPGVDGWEICRRVREACDVPVVMVTARNTKNDVVKGFELGADDYVTKPFDYRELVARVRAILQRSKHKGGDEPAVFNYNGLQVDIVTHSVSIRGRKVKLSPTEFSLLTYLVRNQNRVIGHKELLLHVWGPAYVNGKEYIKLYIHYLRKKLEENPQIPKFILSERGIGYRLAVEA